LRFEDRFDFDISTGDLDTSSIHVPPMLTQPFIENAIEHGRLETIEGGMIHIRFSLEDDLMKIVVEDNGVGKDTPKTKDESNPHTSMAIAITRERIELLNVKNNANGSLQILDKTEEGSSGTRVTILTYCKKLNE
jgi:LytS/YehU family sensor histidine kinase